MRAATSLVLAAAAALNALDGVLCWLGSYSGYDRIWAAADEDDRLDQMEAIYNNLLWGGLVFLAALAIAGAAVIHSRRHAAAVVLVALAAGATVGARFWLRLSNPVLSIAAAATVVAGLILLLLAGRGFRSATILRHYLGASALLATALWSMAVWLVFATTTWNGWWLAKAAAVMAVVSFTLLIAVCFTFAGWRIPRLIALATGWITYAITMSVAVPLVGGTLVQYWNEWHNSPTHLGGFFFVLAIIPLVLLAPLGFSLLAQRSRLDRRAVDRGGYVAPLENTFA